MSNYDNDVELDVTNPAPRCPVLLLLDVSGSMEGEPLRQLQAGLDQFLRETSDDETASMSVELEIITFGGEATIVTPFAPVATVAEYKPEIHANGSTPMGEALRLASVELSERRKLYRAKGIACYKPWVILMTDGYPNDDWESSAASMKRQAEDKKLQFIGIGIGDDADFATLAKILPAKPGPVKLKGLCFKEFFSWLTDSLRSVSASSVAEQDNIRLGSVSSWADLAGTPVTNEE